jgi:hypothetical protein
MQIISDRQIRHRSETRGAVVTREQVLVANGRTFDVRFWHQFETGKLIRVDSVERVRA